VISGLPVAESNTNVYLEEGITSFQDRQGTKDVKVTPEKDQFVRFVAQ